MRALATLFLVVTACVPAALEVRHSDEPVLSLLLQRDPASSNGGAAPADSTLWALLVTSGTAIASPYRVAESFTMTRRSDGATFDWQHHARTGAVSAGMSGIVVLSSVGNYALPWEGSGGRLGRRDLAGGEAYDVVVVTGGRTIEGSVVLPADPVLELVESEGVRHVRWDPVIGGAAYVVAAQTDVCCAVDRTATAYTLKYDLPAELRPDPPYFTLQVLDVNLASAVASSAGGSAVGLSGGWGYLVAQSWARLELPP